MRIAIAHPALLAGSSTEGGIKSTRALVAALVAAGHDCDVITVARPEQPAPDRLWETLGWERLSSYQPRPDTRPGTLTFSVTEPSESVGSIRNAGRSRKIGLSVLARFVRLRQSFMSLVKRRVRQHRPEWVLWENGVGSLRGALSLSEGRLLVQVKSPYLVPFGPYGAPPWYHLSGLGSYRRVPRFMVPSFFMREYLWNHARLRSCVQRNVAYGKPPFPMLANFDGPITMINPTAAKGVAIFTALARHFSGQPFRAVRTWGPLPPELTSLPNVEVVSPSDDMNQVLAGAKLLLVPSIWGEAFGMVCVDALLRGVPVVYSNDGGVPEAALGLGSPIPIRPRLIHRRPFGGARMVYPDQELEPWVRALEALIADRSAFDERSRASREKAHEHLAALSLRPLEEYLGGPFAVAV